MPRALALAALGFVAACQSITADGFLASAGGVCPDGFHLASDGHCYRRLPAEASTGGSAQSRDAATVMMVADASAPVDGNRSTYVAADAGTAALQEVVAVAAGLSHTCGVLRDKSVWCWGLNQSGQLGDGTHTDSSKPVHVSGLGAPAISVSSGGYYTCALLGDGTVWCWGFNDSGQLGDGSTTDAASPVEVTNLNRVMAIAAGSHSSCAVIDDHSVSCWGRNDAGQLGNQVPAVSPTPLQVIGLADAAGVAVGDGYACAFSSSGALECWGRAPLATAYPMTTWEPLDLGLSHVNGVATGFEFTCVTESNALASCWGTDEYGQLGDGNNPTGSATFLTPVVVSSLQPYTGIACGQSHSCALSDGAVYCWGSNDSGQLGTGTLFSATTPTMVKGLAPGAVAIATGRSHSCAVLTDGRLQCWGANVTGQLGDGTHNDSTTPVTVLSP